MNNGHLSDGQIQEILDAERAGGNPFAPWHLKDCPACRGRLQEYRRLYSGLEADPGFALPPAFVDALLERIPARRRAWARPALRVAMVAAGAAALAALPLVVDVRPLLGGTARLSRSFLVAFGDLGAQALKLLAAGAAFGKLLFFGALGLSGAALVDRLLQRQALHRGR